MGFFPALQMTCGLPVSQLNYKCPFSVQTSLTPLGRISYTHDTHSPEWPWVLSTRVGNLLPKHTHPPQHTHSTSCGPLKDPCPQTEDEVSASWVQALPPYSLGPSNTFRESITISDLFPSSLARGDQILQSKLSSNLATSQLCSFETKGQEAASDPCGFWKYQFGNQEKCSVQISHKILIHLLKKFPRGLQMWRLGWGPWFVRTWR